MMKYLDTLKLPSKEITLIVDNTDVGRRTLAYWIETAPDLNVKIVYYKILSKPFQESDFFTTIKYGNNVFLLDCDGQSALEIFLLADDVGVAGIDKDIKWILSERTMDSLSLSCNIPAGDYYATKPQRMPLNSSYIVNKIKSCQATEQVMQKCSTT